MRISIKCPNCGEVDHYLMVEHVRRYREYDAYGRDLGIIEKEEPFYLGVKKICPKCGKRVDTFVNEGGAN